ncbi:unnamed protein product [Thlaspi arvense]|uniref:Epithiospecifier protein n=1 Tax=Thlaspi arvense TaxID=13288 RepID=A0AAU9RA61_THLAR|nr:unnamed protein product [Thlaspi arvense]
MAPMLQGGWIKIVDQIAGRPAPRSSHGIAVIGDKLYCFGGEDPPYESMDKDLYVFDFNTHSWSTAPARGDVPTINALGTRMVAVGTTLYVFGGRNKQSQFEDFYSYDTVKGEWKFLTKLNQEGGPEARTFHSMTSDENHVYVFGGVSKGGLNATPFRFRTIEAYNIAEGKWTQLPDPGEDFEKRGMAGFLVVQNKIWVVYGFATANDPNVPPKRYGSQDYESNRVHYFDLDTQEWTEVETTGVEKPSPRSCFAHAAVGKYIIIFGGEIERDPQAHQGPGTLSREAFVLDTETLVWERLEGGDEPIQRGWVASTTATIYGKKGLLMHGGKLMNNKRTEDMYFYAVNSA